MTKDTVRRGVENVTVRGFRLFDSHGHARSKAVNNNLSSFVTNFPLFRPIFVQKLSVTRNFTPGNGVVVPLSIAPSVRDASNAFLFQFEKPADQSGAAQQKRAEFGQTYLDRYALPFMVRVTTEKLNIRKDPGTEHDKNGSVEMGEAFTIVEARGDWGRLKSDAGWICLRYTQRV